VVEVGEFLGELVQKRHRSRGDRAAIAAYIRNHRAEIEEYIRDWTLTSTSGGIKLAKRYRKLIEEYEKPPDGLCYLEGIASLRTFHLSRDPYASFGWGTKTWRKRILGYALVVVIIWSVFRIAHTTKEMLMDIEQAKAVLYARTTQSNHLERIARRLERGETP
jgi:hypothetical protein